MHFRDLNLIPSILSAVEGEGYSSPTPIQAAAIPPVLEKRDLLGCAQTGTGKTAAFALPMLQNLAAAGSRHGRPVRALVLTPTRELALQIAESFAAYGRNLDLRQAVIFGGVGDGPQKAKLRAGVDILIATPGRLIDLLGQRALTLSHLEIFTLDEADRMLDMGFVHDVRRICALLPERRQTLLFSATMPEEIRKLANGLLRNPVKVEVAPVSSTAEKIEQSVYFVTKDGKSALLRHILADESVTRVLVFTRTKHGADRLRRSLEQHRIPAEAIHGNKSQGARQRSLANFKDGSSRVLVATDLAARGIDVEEISHVVNYDLPAEPETYVHRIGRTARAGRSGISFSFCTPDDKGLLRDIEKLIRMRIEVAATPAEADLRTPVPQVRPDDAETDGDEAMGLGPAHPRRGGHHEGNHDGQGHRRGRNRRGQRTRGNGESGHRRASTGHNHGPREQRVISHESQAAQPTGNREGGFGRRPGPRDTRPAHLRHGGSEGLLQQGRPHGEGQGAHEKRAGHPGRGDGRSDGNRRNHGEGRNHENRHESRGGQPQHGNRSGKRHGKRGNERSFVREYYSNDR